MGTKKGNLSIDSENIFPIIKKWVYSDHDIFCLLYTSFTSAGLPLGVTFSFLISSPMVDLGSLVLLMSIFGLKIAIVDVYKRQNYEDPELNYLNKSKWLNSDAIDTVFRNVVLPEGSTVCADEADARMVPSKLIESEDYDSYYDAYRY